MDQIETSTLNSEIENVQVYTTQIFSHPSVAQMLHPQLNGEQTEPWNVIPCFIRANYQQIINIDKDIYENTETEIVFKYNSVP